MKNLLKLPRWGMLCLIIMTIILSFIILAKIWFPDLISEELFVRIFMTYGVLILSASIISKMTDYLKSMSDEELEDKGS